MVYMKDMVKKTSVIIVRLLLLAWYGENVSYNVYTYLYPSDTVVDKYQLCA